MRYASSCYTEFSTGFSLLIFNSFPKYYEYVQTPLQMLRLKGAAASLIKSTICVNIEIGA